MSERPSTGEPVGVPDPPTRPGVPLKDRVSSAAGEQQAPPSIGKRRRHCWVDLTGHPAYSRDGKVEGLVLQWAQDERGWVALVAYVVTQPGGDVTVQEWVQAARLSPA